MELMPAVFGRAFWQSNITKNQYLSMRIKGTRRTKKETRAVTHLRRPPRLKSQANSASIRAKKKHKASSDEPALQHKGQGYTAEQRKDYQLRSQRH